MMLTGSLIDTVMNLTAFAFLGAMVWLFLRPLAPPRDQDGREKDG